MIKQIKIKNFKSVQNLEMELGRVNVFIGENGCGKTNVLEAIAIGSAAMENKVDNEFLRARGIRVPEPVFMKSAFEKDSYFQHIEIGFTNEQDDQLDIKLMDIENGWEPFLKTDPKSEVYFIGRTPDLEKYLLRLDDPENSQSHELVKAFFKVRDRFIKESHIHPFLIFSPENTHLRQFMEEGQILPLGIRGEGLFKHLVTLFRGKSSERYDKIKAHLEIIDWFEDLQIPTDLVFTERRVNIKDRFLHSSLQFFDQRSSNEGFLFLLFYFTLFISEQTPKFFAIDNVDNSLNPKLCSKLVEILVRLAAENGKQVMLTAHNPSILDGLDLSDDEQRLFVIYRNADGHTVAKRVRKQKSVNGIENVRLSEAFIRGYLGGIPKNF